MTTPEALKTLNYFRIAVQSALAAGLFLGLPAGLLLWLILIDAAGYSTRVQPLIDILHANGLYSIYILVISSSIWSLFARAYQRISSMVADCYCRCAGYSVGMVLEVGFSHYVKVTSQYTDVE